MSETQPGTHKWYCENSRDSSPWCGEGCGVFYRPERDREACPTPRRPRLTPAQIADRGLVNRGDL